MTDHWQDRDATPGDVPETGATEPEARAEAQVERPSGDEALGSDETQVIEPAADQTQILGSAETQAHVEPAGDDEVSEAPREAEPVGESEADDAPVSDQEPSSSPDQVEDDDDSSYDETTEAEQSSSDESAAEDDVSSSEEAADGEHPAPEGAAEDGEHPSSEETGQADDGSQRRERRPSQLWWAWCLVAAIVVVAVVWVGLFAFAPSSDDYFAVTQDPAEVTDIDTGTSITDGALDQEADEAGTDEAEATDAGVTEEPTPDVPSEPETVTPSEPTTNENPPGTTTNPENGTPDLHAIIGSDGREWRITPQGLLAPVEIDGMGDDGVTIGFTPDENGESVAIRFTSLQVNGQTYAVGAPDSPVHYEITAGHGGARDITADPSFSVGTDQAGNFYGERVLIRVDGLSAADYNGMVLSLEEIGRDGTPVPGTITLNDSFTINDD